MIYVFGDSFGYQSPDKSRFYKYEDYIDIVARELKEETIRNYSCPGASNAYIYHTLMGAIKEHDITENDYVILITTQKSRYWVFQDRPHLSNFSRVHMNGDISKEEEDAIKKFLLYLQHDDNDTALSIMFHHAIFYVAQAMPARMLILPGFHNCPNVTGTLNDASFAEFSYAALRDDYFRSTGDYRPNHFLEENHVALAGKILDFFKNGGPIDLTTGFKSGQITKENLKEYLTL